MSGRNTVQADTYTVTRQAKRVTQAEETLNLTVPGTHAHQAAEHWLEGHREVLAQMIVDARQGQPIAPTPVVRRWSWRSFRRSRLASALLLMLVAVVLAGVTGVFINLLDGGLR